MKLNLSPEEVKELSHSFNVIPLYTELLVDTETPLSLFLKLKEKGKFNILLESAEGGEKWGRYSFAIFGSSLYVRGKGSIGELYDRGRVEFFETDDPLDKLRSVVKRFRPYQDGNLPRFWGGLVGYVAYDVVKFYEPVPDENPDPINTYDYYMVLTDTVLIHDNLTGKVKILVPLFTEKGVEKEYDRALRRIKEVVNRLKTSTTTFLSVKEKEPDLSRWSSNFTREEFEDIVKKAKEYIAQGDVIQVVLSQRFRKRFTGNPDNIYRVLRFLNPSPYMYYLDFGELKVIGSSPEILVRLEEGRIETRPIAGTRRRGRTEEEDKLLEKDLLSDEKERAEHLMLVDLARNDIGRVAKTGSVRVEHFMRVERYSHVMHIVSDVVGDLADPYDALDLLRATFPAGTVSGAPKVRAMQIIEELEREKRGIYAGSVGYISFQGNMDMAIAIRTAVYRDEEIFVQAGAGIVADSVPEREWEETVNKARALMKAVEMAEESVEE
ncbi:MAG: anthranilate synthase component I [Aquificae bacterium]|nr:anthranilate synthase component I [Aquificota bacterium]